MHFQAKTRNEPNQLNLNLSQSVGKSTSSRVATQKAKSINRERHTCNAVILSFPLKSNSMIERNYPACQLAALVFVVRLRVLVHTISQRHW